MNEKAIERLYQYLDYKRVKPTRYEKDLGLSNGYLGTQLRRKGNLGEDVINNVIDNSLDLNPIWFVTGKGEMLKGEQDNLQLKEPLTNYEPLKYLPLIPLNAMAGYANDPTIILELDCEKFLVPTFKGADFLIQVKGNSMQPRYNSGDIVACKKLSIHDVFFQWGKVYVLDTDQGPLVKRIQQGHDNEHILVVSDNNELYKPFSLHLSKINALAIVMGIIRLV